jgi:hypothetical protein
LKDKIKKNRFKTKETTIKRIKTRFDIKIIWNQILRDEIENKTQLWKGLKNINKKSEDQI